MARRFVSLLVLALLACSEPGNEPRAEPRVPDDSHGFSADAQIGTWRMLVEDAAAQRHPADLGGRGRLIALERLGGPTGGAGPASAIPASGFARIALEFEVGPLGIADGGGIRLHVPSFWGWDSPQTRFEADPAYTTVSTEARGVELAASVAMPFLLDIDVRGRSLAPGERVAIVYGAGSRGARVDLYAERASPFWFSVDGDGDGVYGLIPDPPAVDIVPGAPARLIATLPTTAEPGDTVDLVVAMLDRAGNGPVAVDAVLRLRGTPGLEVASRVELADGLARVPVRVAAAGIHRIEVRGEGRFHGAFLSSNPLVARAGLTPIRWGDLHGHSRLSDGTGLPADYLRYARDVAALDVVALTDHDHWGIDFLDTHPRNWDALRADIQRFHEPGRFVTVLGFEWTSWLHGHRHVLYFDDGGEVLSSIAAETETPAQLWSALRGKPALTFAHHSAGGPISTNWDYAPPPDLEPVTEIVSAHGSSESADTPLRIQKPVPGNGVRDALARGYRLGFVGSGDSHDGHPGLAGLAAANRHAGLAAIRTRELTRAAVREALLARQTYATNGPRIFLRTELDGRPDGSDVPLGDAPMKLRYEVAGTAPIERIDFVRGQRVESAPGGGRQDLEGARTIRPLAPGETFYVRVVQVDQGAAWSSPFFGGEP